MLTLLGFFIQRTRPAEGLVAVTSRIVLGAKVKVREFVPVRRVLDERLSLKKELRLISGDMVLGRYFLDCNSRVEVIISPKDEEQLASFLPGSSSQKNLLKILKTVISAYVGYRVEVDLTLEVEAKKLPPASLGKASSRLGFTGPIGSTSDSIVKIKLWRHAA